MAQVQVPVGSRRTLTGSVQAPFHVPVVTNGPALRLAIGLVRNQARSAQQRRIGLLEQTHRLLGRPLAKAREECLILGCGTREPLPILQRRQDEPVLEVERQAMSNLLFGHEGVPVDKESNTSRMNGYWRTRSRLSPLAGIPRT